VGADDNPFDENGEDFFNTTLELGAKPGSEGRLTVHGGRSEVITTGADNAISVGDEGNGTLVVEDGGTVNTLNLEVARRGDGTVTLRGSDTEVIASTDFGTYDGEFSFEAGFVEIANAGSAELNIVDGATLTARNGDPANTDTVGPGLNIGDQPGSEGDVVVDGVGSRIDILQDSPAGEFGPFFQVGANLGKGDATIRNEGEVVVRGPGSVATVGEADPSGAEDSDDASLNEPSSLAIESGGALRLIDQTDADANGNGLFIGNGAEGDGTVSVSGNGSLLSVQAPNFMQIAVANDGRGTLNVTDGARVVAAGTDRDNSNVNFNIGDNIADAEGAVMVSDPGSEINISGHRANIRVGFMGNGTLSVSNRASVSLEGDDAVLEVGQQGHGDMKIEDGGRVSVEGGPAGTQPFEFPNIDIGDQSSANGTVTVDGRNSSLSVDGGTRGVLNVGKSGTGSLTIRNGADVEAGAMRVGLKSGADGSVTIDGESSLLSIATQRDGEFVIGADFNPDGSGLVAGGNGTVIVRNGATIRAGTNEGDNNPDINVGANGTLRVESGGNIIGDVNTLDGGTFEMGNSPGTAAIGGDVSLAGGATTFELDGTGDGQFDRIDVAGDATLGGEVTVDVGGGFTPAAGDSFAIVDADGSASLAQDLDVSTEGLPDELAIDLDAEVGAIIATVVDASDPHALG